jgi:hypothetical protein
LPKLIIWINLSSLIFRAKFEESQQITLSEMDATKKKAPKQDMNSLIKSNEEIRNMRFHHYNVEELEENLTTNISDSKFPSF